MIAHLWIGHFQLDECVDFSGSRHIVADAAHNLHLKVCFGQVRVALDYVEALLLEAELGDLAAPSMRQRHHIQVTLHVQRQVIKSICLGHVA